MALERVLADAPEAVVILVTSVYLMAPERSWFLTARPMVQVTGKVPGPFTLRLAVHSVCFLPPRLTAFWVIFPAAFTRTELFKVILELAIVRVVFFTLTVGAAAGTSPRTECPPLPAATETRNRRRKRVTREDAIASLRLYARRYGNGSRVSTRAYKAAALSDPDLVPLNSVTQFGAWGDLRKEAGI